MLTGTGHGLSQSYTSVMTIPSSVLNTLSLLSLRNTQKQVLFKVGIIDLNADIYLADLLNLLINPNKKTTRARKISNVPLYIGQIFPDKFTDNEDNLYRTFRLTPTAWAIKNKVHETTLAITRREQFQKLCESFIASICLSQESNARIAVQ